MEDTVNISIPSSTPSESQADRFNLPTLQPVSKSNIKGYEKGLSIYAETLTSTLNSWAQSYGSDFRVTSFGGVDRDAGIAMVTLNLGQESGPMTEVEIKKDISQYLKKGLEAVTIQSSAIRSERELFWFERERIHIIRPVTLAHWTRTVALNDADTIYGEIAMARRGTNA